MFRLTKLFVLTLVLTMMVSFTQAQIPADGLIAFRQGDLWTWAPSTGTARALTTWGYNGGPILSPDGTKIAYLSWASETVDKLNSGEIQPPYSALPANIWVMETATENFERVANQVGANEFGIFRSYPAWSPDSTQLVWSEVAMTDSGFSYSRLVIYDFNSGSQRILINDFDLGFQDVALHMPPVKWGAGGISRSLFTFEGAVVDQQTGSVNPRSLLQVWNPQSGAMSELVVGDGAADVSINGHVWAGNQVLVLNSEGSWLSYNPATNSATSLSGTPALRLRNGAGVVLSPLLINSTNFYGLQWQASYNGVNTILPIDGAYSIDSGQSVPVISPDGRNVAWNNNGTVTVWNAETQAVQTVITPPADKDNRYIYPLSVVWGAMEWSLNGNVVQPGTCALPAQLSAGQTAVVSDGEPNVVRNNAGLSATRTGQIRAGETAVIRQGPVCADGYNWYFIEYGDGTGWTAEGSDGEYWLRAVDTQAECWNAPAPRLAAGMAAYVLPGIPNVIRTGPGIGDDVPVIGNIPGGAQFTVTGAGVCANDGRRWYPIEYNGQTGWTGEGEGNTYWVAPSG